jgi:hypothetical protein
MYAPIIEALTDVNGHQRHRIKNKLQTNSIKKKKKKRNNTAWEAAPPSALPSTRVWQYGYGCFLNNFSYQNACQ